MAKRAYIGVGGVARKVKQPFVGVANVARKVKSGYIGVGGVARQFFALHRIPDAYQEVEYIESTGTQFVNLGFTAVNGFKVVIDMMFTTLTTSNEYSSVIGAENRKSPWASNMMRYDATYSHALTVLAYVDNSSGYIESSIPVSANVRYNIEASTLKSGIYLTIDGVNAGTASNTNNRTSNEIYLFCDNGGGTARRHSKMRLYDTCFIYDSSNNLIRSLVPCYRKSDNVAGLYDLVNAKFYTNSGTGTFSVGKNV